MSPQWYRKALSPEKIAVDEASVVLDRVRERRKNLLAHVIQKIEEVPLDDRLFDLGSDLRGKKNRK